MKNIKSQQTHHHLSSSRVPTKQLVVLTFLFTLASLLLVSCAAPTTSEPAAETDTTEQSDYADKKIVWVDSYHQGYEWSDGIEAGVMSVLDETGAEVKTIHLDTKLNVDTAFGEQAGTDAWAEIEAFAPDIVIACDDNAQSYLVVPYIKDTDLPVVFCGVNWNADAYGYPTGNVTGMLEHDLAKQMVELLEPYAEGERLVYLTGESVTERKNIDIYNDLFFNGEMEGVFVANVEDWQSEFLRLQDDADMIFMGNNAGIEGWDDTAVETFVLENTKIPVGSTNDWLAPYSLFVVAKSAHEHGAWSAETSLNILSGTSVSDIPVSVNKESALILNLNLADKLEAVIEPGVLRQAEIHGE